MKKILVTGGSGYIGSHTCVELIKAGHDVVVYDNFCNSNPEALHRIEKITTQKPKLVHGDIRDQGKLEFALRMHACDAVMHFAGLKAVGESVDRPIEYYDNNVNGTLCLLRAMQATSVKTLVFSSSATVYGQPQFLPFTEDHPLIAVNPYGQTKLMVEQILQDLYNAEPDMQIAILRYFNPVGAHPSGLIGEDPKGLPNNLMPYVAQVAIGRRDKLQIFGGDYPTRDGTGVRDYIHVVDLAIGHLKALEYMQAPECLAINLGAGVGYSVLEVVTAFENASGQPIPYVKVPRRLGDLAEYYADPSMAEKLLGWKAQRTLLDMCTDTWRWQVNNPNGYSS